MKTLDMIKLFHEHLDASHETFVTLQRPITDTVLRLLNDSYLASLDGICRAGSFPLSAQQVRANLAALRRFIVMESLTPDGTLDPNISYIDSSTIVGKFLYFIKAEVKMTRTAVPEVIVADWVETQPVHESQAETYLATIYNKPIIRVPAITFTESAVKGDPWRMAIYTDVYSTLTQVRLTYIKEPSPLVADLVSECILEPESLCHDIVRKALDTFLTAKSMFAPKKAKTKAKAETEPETEPETTEL